MNSELSDRDANLLTLSELLLITCVVLGEIQKANQYYFLVEKVGQIRTKGNQSRYWVRFPFPYKVQGEGKLLTQLTLSSSISSLVGQNFIRFSTWSASKTDSSRANAAACKKAVQQILRFALSFPTSLSRKKQSVWSSKFQVSLVCFSSSQLRPYSKPSFLIQAWVR